MENLIDETLAQRAKENCSFDDYDQGSTTEGFNSMIETARQYLQTRLNECETEQQKDGWAKDEELTKMLEKPEISKIRESTGMSQSQFAKQFGISIRTLQDWEQGRRKMPSYVLDMIELLADENKAGKHLAWYVVCNKNGEVFGMDKPFVSFSAAMRKAYSDWNIYTTDAEKEHQSIHVALIEVDNGNDDWSGDEYKSFDIDEINQYGQSAGMGETKVD